MCVLNCKQQSLHCSMHCSLKFALLLFNFFIHRIQFLLLFPLTVWHLINTITVEFPTSAFELKCKRELRRVCNSSSISQEGSQSLALA